MSSTLIKELASKFSLTESQLIEQGLRAFLQDQLHMFDAELRTIFARHRVQSLEEFDQLLADHPDEESDLLPDFQRADFLIYRIGEISQWIRQLNGER